MKNILKIALFSFILLVSLSGCVKEDEFIIPPFNAVVFKENFDAYEVNDDEYFNFENWVVFNEAGSPVWFEKKTGDFGYIEFNSFRSGDLSNISWAITPKINLDSSENEILNFKTASEYVTSASNKLEVFISTDFNGKDVLLATWIPLQANIANHTTNIDSGDSNGLINIPSGDVDLSSYSGDVYIAFKGTGSGTNLELDGSLRLDDIKIFNKNFKN